MNKRIKKLITLGVLSTTLISNRSIVYADIEKPTKPEEITGEVTNEKIQEYNKQVDDYNSKVDEYNQKVDEQYQLDIESVKHQNEEVDKHNQAEDAKVAAVEASNVQKQEEYNKLYEQYQKDLNTEKQLQEKYGYESTAAYNEYAKTHFNDIVDAALVKNADATRVFDIDKSYTVSAGASSESTDPESENPTPEPIGEAISDSADAEDTSQPPTSEPAKVKVHLEHKFLRTEQVYSKDFEILETDIITFYAAGAQLEPTDNEGTCAFYMYSPEDLRQGYWYECGSMAYDTAVYKDSSGWQNGNIYVLSYKDGTHNPGDSTDIDMIFEYTWAPVNKWPLYNIPIEPKLELDSYTPNYQEKIAEPNKPEHLEHLDKKELLPDSEKPTDDGNDDKKPDNNDDSNKNKNKKKSKKPKEKEEEKPKEEPQPQPQPEKKQEEEVVTIKEETTPMANTIQQPIQTEIKPISTPVKQARRPETSDNATTKRRYIISFICGISAIILIYIFIRHDLS